jgi:hypothetical protein
VCLWWRLMSHIYREVKPTSCHDRDLNRLGLGFRLSYLIDLGTESPKIKTAKGRRTPARRGADFGGPFTQVSRARALRPAEPEPKPGPARQGVACARVWCFIFPPPSHTLEWWRQPSYLCWSSHSSTSKMGLNLYHFLLHTWAFESY